MTYQCLDNRGFMVSNKCAHLTDYFANLGEQTVKPNRNFVENLTSQPNSYNYIFSRQC